MLAIPQAGRLPEWLFEDRPVWLEAQAEFVSLGFGEIGLQPARVGLCGKLIAVLLKSGSLIPGFPLNRERDDETVSGTMEDISVQTGGWQT